MSKEFLAHLAGFRPGSLLAGYRLEALVGQGAMAVVFRARDERLGRLVALKILVPELAANPVLRQRFIGESRAAAQVDHPHVIPVYKADEAGGVLFIAMRFVHGGDLRRLLDEEGMLPPARAMEFIFPLASALDAAHASGLVHRDVKPGNVLVDRWMGRPDHAYLSDFGIAKLAMSATMELTEAGHMMGTPEYSAPEQIEGRGVDGRADQYGLACLAFRLLAGAVPYPRDEVVAVIAAHLYAPPPSLTARRPDLPGAVDKVIAKAMAKAPDQRYESCGDFAEALRAALGVPELRPSGSETFPPGQPVPVPQPPIMRPPVTPSGPVAPTAVPFQPLMRPFTWPPAPGETPTRDDITVAGGKLSPGGLDVPDWARHAPVRHRGPGIALRRPHLSRAVRIGLAPVVLAAAAAVIFVALHRPPPGKASSAGKVAAAGQAPPACGSAFAGYPGAHGDVAADSIAWGGGIRLAVGSADGHPAIWDCGPRGAWQLMSAGSASQSAGILTSVAFGPDGWLAAGEAGSGASQHPIALTSADGATWQTADAAAAFTGPGACVSAVAASQEGYVAVGKHTSGSRIFAAMWWSASMRSWAQGNNDRFGFLDGRLLSSTADAVAATPAGFVAAGTHGPSGAVWTSADHGQQWVFNPAVLPAGALTLVSVNPGGVIVAAGYEVAAGGARVPVVVVSTDDGQQWNAPVVLGPPGSQGSVTALTASGSGFIAAGQIGPAGAARSVTWTSPNGLTWSKAAPVAGGASGAAALSASGGIVTAAAQQCPAPA